MWKKISMLCLAVMIAFSFSAPGVVDAAKYKSSRKSVSPGATNQTPTNNSGVTKTDPAAATKAPATTNSVQQKRGFFSGGGLMKGLMIGGLAGLLFGGLFGGMGFLGDMLGMMVNVLALVVLFVVIRKIYVHFRDKKKVNEQPRNY
ncbi:hypothetical protein [Paenibacillus silviterrae]|uniref:hypothetical protein n=1 Tax=Paenibacillus silviterrae TaxID=3242194 RepID=UPI0025432D45|nr:hypothetical protein [Paenibacillus chinjuensis]